MQSSMDDVLCCDVNVNVVQITIAYLNNISQQRSSKGDNFHGTGKIRWKIKYKCSKTSQHPLNINLLNLEMTNVCTIASTDLYFEIYDLWMVFGKTELGDPGSALPALQLMPPCTSEKNRTYDWVFSPQLIQEILPPPISSAGRSFTTWQTLTPLSLCQLTLCQCTMRKVSTIFTWTTKRDVCMLRQN